MISHVGADGLIRYRAAQTMPDQRPELDNVFRRWRRLKRARQTSSAAVFC
ncbi:MAG: hypothetical protein ACLUEQ_02195 [Cloacibacillus evryensis]